MADGWQGLARAETSLGRTAFRAERNPRPRAACSRHQYLTLSIATFGRHCNLEAMTKNIATILAPLALAITSVFGAPANPTHKILFFSKSSGFEHSVISWKNGQPSYAEKVLLELGQKNGWEFTFSEDG